MGKFLFSMLSNGSDVSSKRFIGFAAFVLMSVGFLANTFFGFKVDPTLFSSIEYIVIAALITTASEKFSSFMGKGDSKSEETPA